MAESSSSTNSNVARIIDCTSDSGLRGKLLNELTGTEVKTDDKSISWSVDNRYYSADISLLINTSDEGNDCEAIVFLYATHESESFVKIKQVWESISDECSPSVCLIVGACSGNEGEESFDEVLKWCVENGFELVEWNYENQITVNDEDSLDRKGVARVSDALQAHMWPDIRMKNNKDHGDKVTSDHSNGTDELKILSRGLNNNGGDPTNDATNITGQETFEELFGRFAEMKVHAETLAHEERKDYAEKVVKAFWQAIGGNEEELRDSD